MHTNILMNLDMKRINLGFQQAFVAGFINEGFLKSNYYWFVQSIL